MFFIKSSRSFALWDLTMPGHPRHVSFDFLLPREPWQFVDSHTNRSKWIIEIQGTKKTIYIYADIPPSNILTNTFTSCECVTRSNQTCYLTLNNLNLKATSSYHHPKTHLLYAGDRFTIRRTWKWTKPDVLLRDYWVATSN